MGSFSIWHWAILVIVLGSIWYAIYLSSRKVNAQGQPEGIGGWLMLMAIGVTIAPLRTLSEISKNVESYGQLMAIPNGPATVYVEVGLFLALLVLQVIVAVALYKKKRTFPRLYMYQWIAAPVIVLIDVLAISYFLKVAPGDLLTVDAVVPVLASFAFGAIWVWYLSASVRVRNTFTEA